ncbi:MAG TPA: TIGR03086 family metal-binding protein [Thermobifida alba]|nr:TIGR03086 family metal-binding protein [Thermobifida alba]
MTQVLKRYDFLAAEFTRRVADVPSPGAWDAPSPCAGWSARDVLRHVVETCAAMPGYVGLTVELAGSVAEDPAAAWAEARDALREILADPARAALEYDGFFGRTRLEATVDRFLGIDLLVHGWDIARATGQDETLPDAEVARVYADVVELGDSLRAEGVCGPAVEVPADAPAQDRLLAFLGRTP